jgi:hypothetical protein
VPRRRAVVGIARSPREPLVDEIARASVRLLTGVVLPDEVLIRAQSRPLIDVLHALRARRERPARNASDSPEAQPPHHGCRV